MHGNFRHPEVLLHPVQTPDVEAGVEEILDILEVPRDKNWFVEHLPKMKRFWEDVMRYRNDESLYSTLYGIDDDRICDLSDITVPDHGDEYAFIDD